MIKQFLFFASILLITSSCVSKKKYVALEENLTDTKAALQKTTMEKEGLEVRFAKIERRVDDYNNKINSLKETNQTLSNDLTLTKHEELVLAGDNLTVMSQEMKDKMNAVLSKLPPEQLAGAQTLQDSINIVLNYNLRKNIATSNLESEEDINVNIDKTVVMISVADNLLFRTASYRVNPKSYSLLQKIADVVKSEPSMDVMVEGHTDSRSFQSGNLLDNWDLSVKRATSITRILQDKFGVNPAQLIASGRSSYKPLVPDDTAENRSRNRRTNIIIMPNLNKFFALLEEEEHILD